VHSGNGRARAAIAAQHRPACRPAGRPARRGRSGAAPPRGCGSADPPPPVPPVASRLAAAARYDTTLNRDAAARAAIAVNSVSSSRGPLRVPHRPTSSHTRANPRRGNRPTRLHDLRTGPKAGWTGAELCRTKLGVPGPTRPRITKQRSTGTPTAPQTAANTVSQVPGRGVSRLMRDLSVVVRR
jgi:hypothetical protein